MRRHWQAGALAVAAAALAPNVASALVITPTDEASALTSALLAPSSGIDVLSGSLQGTEGQSGVYTGFDLGPGTAGAPTLNLPDGATLTSGQASIGTSNTANETSFPAGSGANAILTDIAGEETNDANVLTLTFTVDPGFNAVAAEFVFATEEFPTQNITDIFGFVVDGENYALFPNGEPIANTPDNPANFIPNPIDGDVYAIEYNGLTRVLTVTGLLDMSLSEHTLLVGVADTFDDLFDSGVFVGALQATTAQQGGIDDGGPPTQAPEPATLALLGAGLFGLAVSRRRKSA